MLHSFVLSDFQDSSSFPREFHAFLEIEWKLLTEELKAKEIEILQSIGQEQIVELYQNGTMGYMMSCNYYPKPSSLSKSARIQNRLSSHKDASLFTTFPFGVEKGLCSADEQVNSLISRARQASITFYGYFLELQTEGALKATQHHVELSEDVDSERFSFALFSLPKLGKSFSVGGEMMTSEAYYEKYLKLF